MGHEVRWLNEGEIPKWDAFVDGHQQGWISHLSAWKESLEESFQQLRGKILALVDSSSGAIEAGIPLYEVRSVIGGRRLVSIPFATRSDPLARRPEQVTALAEYMLGYAAARRIRLVEVRTTENESSALGLLGFGVSTSYKEHTISLERGLEEIYASFHRSCVRQRITRSTRNGLRPRKGKSLADLEDFYRLYTGTRRSLCLPALPWSFFRALWEKLQGRGLISLFLSVSSGRAVSAVLTFKYHGRASAECLGWDRDFAAVGATASAFWSAIVDAHGEGLHLFDFGRTAASNESLIDFKRRWGTVEKDLPIWYHPASAASERQAAGSALPRAVFKALAARVPTPLYQLMSTIAYRQLG